MSFDIPAHMEPEIHRYAETQHLSEKEAVVKLIQAGLKSEQKNVILQGLGLFSSPEDAQALDDVVKIAYEERRKLI